MSNAKHTPGPWRVDEYEQADGATRFSVETLKGACLADMAVDDDPGFEKIARADAELMAAAPEMLEALELAIRHLIHFDNTDFIIGPIQKLIAKARGQQCEPEDSLAVCKEHGVVEGNVRAAQARGV